MSSRYYLNVLKYKLKQPIPIDYKRLEHAIMVFYKNIYQAIMTRTSFNEINCSLARTIDIIGDKWSLLIIRDAFFGVQRFSEFEDRLGIAKTVLSSRLNTLVENEILKKVPTSPEVDRFIYKLTPRGRDLLVTVVSLVQWGDKWIFGQGQEPIEIWDKEELASIQKLDLQAHSGKILEARDVVFKPGPGATSEMISMFENYDFQKSQDGS